MKPCKKCGNESPDIILSKNNGWVVVCKCGKSIGGYKREEWAKEAWDYDN